MPSQSSKISNKKSGVSIIGLGPMGQAMARVYLAAGYSVTVWNRTTGKAEALVKEGAVHAEIITDALKARNLIILSLTEYDVMYKVLDDAENALKGRVLINLSSDTPKKVRTAEKWIDSHNARFLSGGVMVDPSLVGKPDAFIFYSGDREVFDAHQQTLAVMGKPDYLGSDAGLSQLYYQALLNIMYTSAAGVLHSMALMQSAGISVTSFEPYVNNFLKELPYFFEDMAIEVDKGLYDGEQNNMKMMAAGMTHVAHTSRDAKINTALPDLLKKIFDQTVANGFAGDGLTSIVEVLKNPRV